MCVTYYNIIVHPSILTSKILTSMPLISKNCYKMIGPRSGSAVLTCTFNNITVQAKMKVCVCVGEREVMEYLYGYKYAVLHVTHNIYLVT